MNSLNYLINTSRLASGLFIFTKNKCRCIDLNDVGHELFIEIGPQFGFLINEKEKEYDKKWYGGVSGFDLSLGFGGGISFKRKHELSARYNYGLTDIYKNYYGENITSNLSFTYSYIF